MAGAKSSTARVAPCPSRARKRPAIAETEEAPGGAARCASSPRATSDSTCSSMSQPKGTNVSRKTRTHPHPTKKAIAPEMKALSDWARSFEMAPSPPPTRQSQRTHPAVRARVTARFCSATCSVGLAYRVGTRSHTTSVHAQPATHPSVACARLENSTSASSFFAFISSAATRAVFARSPSSGSPSRAAAAAAVASAPSATKYSSIASSQVATADPTAVIEIAQKM
mmetsp:Transcript_20312/g.60494  ORF Transcript_20312/g.60494 Transcript_20312/m.60494 type:complete len:226 (+) Transcript_20312:413-1090(+)